MNNRFQNKINFCFDRYFGKCVVIIICVANTTALITRFALFYHFHLIFFREMVHHKTANAFLRHVCGALYMYAYVVQRKFSFPENGRGLVTRLSHCRALFFPSSGRRHQDLPGAQNAFYLISPEAEIITVGGGRLSRNVRRPFKSLGNPA